MMKVFLVDDEIAIRENLRTSFPWEKEGFVLVGEAPDGEMALPMIRDLNPDILLTDIRMPFMDGISLCREVHRTMPWVGVVILSGYDDFSYAQQAISLGVREYLLKPLSAGDLTEALKRVASALVRERREQESMAALRRRMASGSQFLKEKMLASLFTEQGDRYEDEALISQMREMGVNLAANCYTVIDISFKAEEDRRAACRSALSSLCDASGGGVMTCSAVHGARALVLGDNEKDTEERAYSFAQSASKQPELASCEHLLLAIGETVSDYYEIRRSMQSARHIRHVMHARGAERTIVGVAEVEEPESGGSLRGAELSPLHERLQYASADTVEPILMEYSSSLDPELAAGYLRVAAMIAAGQIIQEAGGNPKEVLEKSLVDAALHEDGDAAFAGLTALLQSAMAYRDSRGNGYGDSPVNRARRFLSLHFDDPNLMLQDVADEVGLSQSHFSTVFAQETGITYTQYLTDLRIAKAKELLRATSMRSSEIAFAIGYHDSHYFSYLFKKTTGMTPSEYRRSVKK